MKHIIFDFDGVLADSRDFHIRKINELFGIGITRKEYENMHNGNFYNATLKKMEKFDPHTYPDLVSEEQGRLPISPDVKGILEKLASNHSLHIISSGWERQILPFLQFHNIKPLFTELLFADHGKSKKDKFNMLLARQNTFPNDCLFITDTLGDIHEAHTTHIQTIAVTFGFHDKERLLKGNPHALAGSWVELEKSIENFKSKQVEK